MRAYQLPQAAGIDALAKVDIPTPKPAHRQVLVKIAACSLNFRDLAIVLGRYRMTVKPNVIPLSDGSGEVVDVGVTKVKTGDLRPAVDKVFSFDETAAAFRHMQSAQHFGKIVISLA